MKHDLLVLLLLLFGVSGVAQTSGSNQKQSKHRFSEMQYDRSTNLSSNRIQSTFRKGIYFGSGNEVIFNNENAVTGRLKPVVCTIFLEYDTIKQLFMNY
ncbi:MAG: hypothetical protein QE487_11320 [Fluviicola sp.]|nr:hypothetical protein [Fluviicola sp.]